MPTIRFPREEREAILKRLREAMQGSLWTPCITLEFDGSILLIKVQKLGLSLIRYQERQTETHLIYEALDEKIAWAHRPFREEVESFLLNAVAAAGGSAVRERNSLLTVSG